MILLKKEKEAIKKYKQYIEGIIDFESFWKDYISCKYLMKYLTKTAHRKNIGCVDEYYFSLDPKKKENPSFHTKYLLQWSICYYLDKKKIDYVNNRKEYYLYEKWNDYIPSFVPYNESNYYLLESLDNGKRHSKKYYRDYFSNIYKYEKYPPRWLQTSEWPIDDDGTPTKFLYQTGFPNNYDIINYWFQKKDGSKIKIQQYI